MRVHILGVATKQRLSFRPDIPTIGEQGLPGYLVRSWTWLFAPRGTPQPITERVATAMREVLALPAARPSA